MPYYCRLIEFSHQRPNPSVKGTSTSGLRPLAAAPYVERQAKNQMGGPFSSYLIGEFLERGYVEALLPLAGRDSLRVCLRVLSNEQSLPQRLAIADALLPRLLEQLGRAEQMANAFRAAGKPAYTWDIWIEEDNSAFFRCAPNEAEPDEFSVVEWSAGTLVVKQ